MKRLWHMLKMLMLVCSFIATLEGTSYGYEKAQMMEKDARIEAFFERIQEYESDFMPELSQSNILDRVIQGDAVDSKNVIHRVLDLFVGELKDALRIIFSMIAVSLLCGVLKNIQSSFGGNVSEVAFYVCYLFILLLIIRSFTDVMTVCEQTITKLSDFMNMLIPLLLALLVANGSITTVGMLQPVLVLMISFINILISKCILPVIFIATMIHLISLISENINVSKLPKFLQKASFWALELVLLIFFGVLSVEGTLAANVDGIAAKGAKTIVSTVIPVVGKALSDATDSILGAASIMKNALGVLGVLVILGIALAPLVKVLVMTLIYHLGAALMEPIVDKRITTALSTIGDSMKMTLALLATISVLFILATTLLIKMGNFTIMYR